MRSVTDHARVDAYACHDANTAGASIPALTDGQRPKRSHAATKIGRTAIAWRGIVASDPLTHVACHVSLASRSNANATDLRRGRDRREIAASKQEHLMQQIRLPGRYRGQLCGQRCAEVWTIGVLQAVNEAQRWCVDDIQVKNVG